MKLKLKNFRCYENKEFDFGSEGLTLLSGPSGCGKSSIMMAIMFVLYGLGNKLVMFGKTSCSVEFEFEDIYIKRSKKPNRLILTNKKSNEEFEDDTAQSIITQRFGNAFEITSYVQQNTLNSFILMSPLDKLAFLEKFAFSGIDLSQLKGRCSAIIKKRNEELIASTSKLEMASEYLKNYPKPEKQLFPIKTSNKEKTSKNEETRLKNTKILLKRSEKNVEKLKNELTDTIIYKSQIETKKELLVSINEKIKQNELEKNNINYEGDEKLQYHESLLKNFLSEKQLFLLQEKYDIDKKRLQTMEDNEKNNTEKELKEIEDNLWKEYSEEDILKNINEYENIIKDAEKLYFLKINLDDCKIDNNKHLENKKTLQNNKISLQQKKDLLNKLNLQKEIYSCPSCDSSLKIKDNKLYLVENLEIEDNINLEELKKQITILVKTTEKLEYVVGDECVKITKQSEIQKKIDIIEKQYEEQIPDKNDLENTLTYLKEYKREQEQLEKKKKKLQNKDLSSSLEIFKNQLLAQENTINNLKKYKSEVAVTNIDEEELRTIINTQQKKKQSIILYDKHNKDLFEQLLNSQKSLDILKENFFKKYENERTTDDIKNEISKIENEVLDLKNTYEKHEKNIKDIEKYNKYIEEIKIWNEWKQKVNNLTDEEQKNQKRYASSLLLKDKILEAESLAILNIISSINTHAQEYLDIFFPVDPIVVRLSAFKTSKKNISKPQINLEIDYKGMEADINMLSGGELARVILAYTLALSEIFNSPMIMLDECTASLDQDMTSIVMDGIRKNFGNKLTVVIAHQVISGEFDRQICL